MDGIRKSLFTRTFPNNVELSDIAQIYQPVTISSTELTETGYPVYGANGIIGYYSQYNHEKEQICITCRGNTCGTVNYTMPFSWITGNSMVINVDTSMNISKRYLYHYLCNLNFSRIISGFGQPQIVREPLMKIKIPIPDLEKQLFYAKTMDSLSCMINLADQIKRSFIAQKHFLLSHMFI